MLEFKGSYILDNTKVQYIYIKQTHLNTITDTKR
jgi:hypothetical protein